MSKLFGFACNVRSMFSVFVLVLLWSADVHTDIGASTVNALRDPTKPLSFSKKKTDRVNSLVLQAVFNGQQRPSAIINGQALTIGESIYGWTLTKVQAGSVLLVESGRQHRLYLRTSVSKKAR